jgi:hypothetical protein
MKAMPDREVIDTGTDKRYVRRDERGRFKRSKPVATLWMVAPEAVKLFGWRRQVILAFWCEVFYLFRVTHPRRILASRLGPLSRRQRVIEDFRRLSRHLVESGYELPDDEDEAVAWLIHEFGAEMFRHV